MVMVEEGFSEYLKKTGKSERKIEFDLRKMMEFEEYLSEHKEKGLEEVTPEDLKDFVNWAEETGAKV